MDRSGVDDRFDLGAWAAYAVGRHPYALADWHSYSWSRLRNSDTILDLGRLYGAPPELEELDKALRILAREGNAYTFELDILRNCMTIFTILSKEIYESFEDLFYEGEMLDWDSNVEPCERELGDMMWLSGKLITGSDELRLWERCGASIGECLGSAPHAISGWRWESPQDRLQTLLGAIQELARTGEYPFLTDLAGDLLEYDSQAVGREEANLLWADGIWRRRLGELDTNLRDALRTQAPPKIWLEFIGEQLIFFDARYFVGNLPKGEKDKDFRGSLSVTEAAFLWVLADRLGEDVTRRLILDEGGIEGSPEGLTVIASRLRDKLKPALETFFEKRASPRPEYAGSCFIVGRRGGYSNGRYERAPGPYTLKLPPHRVRISSVRPQWVGPRWGP